MKFFNLFLLLFLIQLYVTAQENEQKKKEVPAGRKNLVTAGVLVPFGEFSKTHGVGMGLVYSRTSHRYIRFNEVLVQKFGFTYETGLAFYPGKNERVSETDSYKYPGFILMHGHAGMICNLVKNLNIRVVAGPALGFYDGRARFNFGAQLSSGYFPWERLGIGPGMNFYMEPGSAPLAAATLHLQFTF